MRARNLIWITALFALFACNTQPGPPSKINTSSTISTDSTTTPIPSVTPFLTPTTTPTLAPIGEAQPIGAGYIYLGDPETMALGFNLSAGGSIGSLLWHGHDLVDDTDYGRYIQLSPYDGNDTYGPAGNDPYGNWGWNPLQSGSKAGGSSLVGGNTLDLRTGENFLYVKALAKEWGQYDQDSDTVYETWAWKREGYFEVHSRATHVGDTYHAGAGAEFPAAYFDTSLTKEYTYLGETPFTGAPIDQLNHVNGPGQYAGTANCPMIVPSENWAAFGDGQDALVLAVPPQHYLLPSWAICLLYDVPPVGYVSPTAFFDFAPGDTRDITYYLIPGPVEDARQIVYDLIPHTTWTFDLDSLEGWQSTTKAASTTNGVATIELGPDDQFASSPNLHISGAVSPTVRVQARTQGQTANVCLDFLTAAEPFWDAAKSACLDIISSDFKTYTFALGDNPAWIDGLITQLRLHADAPTTLEIDSMTVEIEGKAWEFDVNGDPEGWVALNHMEPIKITDGVLQIQSTGDDPYMFSSGLDVDADHLSRLQINMKVSDGGSAQLFFMPEGENDFTEENSLVFYIFPSSLFHTYSLDLSTVSGWKGKIKQIRLDPTNAIASIDIDYIRLLPKP